LCIASGSAAAPLGRRLRISTRSAAKLRSRHNGAAMSLPCSRGSFAAKAIGLTGPADPDS
jgi:hypothetical protein